jgi:hypothetical protein
MKLEYEKLGISYQKNYNFFYNEIPVFISSADTYNQERIKRLSIAVFGGYINGFEYFNRVIVQAFNPDKCHTQQEDIFSYKSETDVSPQFLLDMALEHINDNAVEILENLPIKYAKAKARIAEGWEVASRYRDDRGLTREAYQKACKEVNQEPMTDEKCDSYGVKYGVFHYPQYDPETIIKMQLASLRLMKINQEKEEKAKNQPKKQYEAMPTKMTGQLWEECEICGDEPVYMPLHLCEKCWSKPMNNRLNEHDFTGGD